MKTRIDVAAAGQTAEARALLDRLDDSQVISLGVLSGADLCMLGAVGHPVCWEALRRAWRGWTRRNGSLRAVSGAARYEPWVGCQEITRRVWRLFTM